MAAQTAADDQPRRAVTDKEHEAADVTKLTVILGRTAGDVKGQVSV